MRPSQLRSRLAGPLGLLSFTLLGSFLVPSAARGDDGRSLPPGQDGGTLPLLCRASVRMLDYVTWGASAWLLVRYAAGPAPAPAPAPVPAPATPVVTRLADQAPVAPKSPERPAAPAPRVLVISGRPAPAAPPARPDPPPSVAAQAPPANPLADKLTEPLTRTEINIRVRKSMLDAIKEGADLYNTGYPSACAHLFQGSLMALDPLLDHLPEAQNLLRKGLTDAKKINDMDKRAWAFRYLLDDVRAKIPGPVMGKMVIGEGETLWLRLGGPETVTKIISDCLDAAIADPKVNFFRSGKYPSGPAQVAELKKKLVLLTSAATGGPDKYQGKGMKEVHKEMGITDPEYNQLLVHLRVALIRNAVKQDDIKKVLEAAEVVRADIVQPPKSPAIPLALWDRIGEERIRKVVGDWVDATIADPKVNFTRNGKYPMNAAQIAEMKNKIVMMTSAVGGGPYKYEGKGIRETHRLMGITDVEFDAVIRHLAVAMGKHKLNALDMAFILQAIQTRRADIVEPR